MLLGLCSIGAHASSAWTRQQSGTMAWLHAVYFLDERKGWAVGSSGALLRTEDGGASWAVMRRPTEDALRDIYFADERRGWLVCERSIYLLKEKDEPRTYLMNTTDGGQSWRRVNVTAKDVDARLVRALFTTAGRAWAFGEAGALYTTRDGGGSWVRQRVPTRHLLLGGAFLNEEEGWLVGAGATLLQTSDGGETWRAGTIMGQPAQVRFTAVSFVDSQRGWAVGSGGRVFTTTDGGRRWRAQVSPVVADLYDVKFLSATEGWAVGAEGTVIHTTDGGRSWATEPSGTTHPLERLFFVNRERGWAVGFGGTIIAYAPNATPPKAPELKRRGSLAHAQSTSAPSSSQKGDRISSLRAQINEATNKQERARLQRTLVDYLIALGRKSEAITELRAMAREERVDAVSFYNIGNALARLGDNDAAVEAYRKAISQRKGNYARALNNLGVVLIRQARWDEAIEALSSALKQERSRYAEASYNLGRVYGARGQLKQAISEWTRALEVQPDHQDAALALARAHAADGNPERGIGVIDAFVARHGPNKALVETRNEILKGKAGAEKRGTNDAPGQPS